MISSLGSLPEFHYDPETKMFTQSWDLDTIERAIEKMETLGYSESIDPEDSNPADVTSLFKKIDINDCRRPHENGEDEMLGNDKEIHIAMMEVDYSVNVHHASTPLLVEGPVLEEWRVLIGDSVDLLTHQEFVKLSKIHVNSYEIPVNNPHSFEKGFDGPPLTLRDLSGWIQKVFPYILQKVKMWGCGVLEPENLKRLVPDINLTQEAAVPKGPNFRRNIPAAKKDLHIPDGSSGCPSVPLSRLDLLTCLINCVDTVVKLDILRNISVFPVAIPLIIPSLFERRMINLLPLLKYISLRKKKPNGDIAQNYLFGPTFKLILCIRLGKTNTVGKSCILNSVLKRKWTFSSKQEPAADLGKPVSLPGFVEFVPLTEETCSTELWKNLEASTGDEEVIFLANMHGDPVDHPEVFETILAMAGGAVVFTLPETTDECGDTWREIIQMFGENTPYLNVDDGEEYQNSIQTADLNNDKTMKKVRTAIMDAVKLKRLKVKEIPVFENVVMEKEMNSNESKNLSNLITENSVSRVKDILSTKDRINGAKHKTIEEEMISQFFSLLDLPIEKRILGLVHLEKELADLTDKQSSKILNELLKLEAEFKAVNGDNKQIKREHLRNLIGNNRELLNRNNLGLEHFYRKIGKMYETALIRKMDSKLAPFLETTSRYAELLINGHAVELLDGESERPVIYATWFTAICQKINEAKPNLRIFVVSVVGLQSSGKSTLLNALFGCKFAVSMGRCTKGLFLRLIFLNDELKKILKKDALFIIDMEGLCSPEMVNDPKAEEKDRIMTTFVMGISNLTLINISGESSNSMTDILQIAIVAMARLHDAKLSPDMIVVQHLNENNAQKVATAHNEFIKAIEKAIGMTEKKGSYIGIHDSKCMKNLMERAAMGNVLKAFGPFRNGEFISSPPSVGYHESILSLYKSILEACRDSDTKQSFESWYKLLNGYLVAVLSENMVVRFKNLVEMSEHLERGSRINEVKEDVEKTFRRHSLDLEPEIRMRIQTLQQNITEKGDTQTLNFQLDKELMDVITEQFRLLPNGCRKEENGTRACAFCEQTVTKMEALFSHVRDTPSQGDTVLTITKFIEVTREACLNRLKNMIGAELLQQGLSKEFCEIINESLLKFIPENRNRTEEEYEDITNEVWLKLQIQVVQKYSYITIHDRIVDDITMTYNMHPDAALRYMSPEEHKLQTKEAYRGSFRKLWQSTPLETKEYNELMMLLDNMTEIFFVQNPNINHHTHGIMQVVKRMIDENINKFEKLNGIQLLGDFKWEIHVYCIKMFALLFYKLEQRWESENDPTIVLQKHQDVYINLIQTRLRYGFSAVGESQVIANLLGKAVSQKAVKYADEIRVGKVLDLPWIVNAENVRLQYFSHLAKKVEEGKTAEAVLYFTSPKTNITEWFVNQVDSMFLEECMAECYTTFQNEMSKVIQTIKNKKTMEEIKQFLDEYFTQVGSSVTYQSTLQGEGGNIQATSLDLLKNAIEQELKDKQKKLESELTLGQPSESTRVMFRMGCTEHCFWCGALCWGQRGHEKITDSTKNHHACHQPSGLKGVSDHYRHTLNAYSCQDFGDDSRVWWGEYSDSDDGMSWRDAKLHPDFKDWMFEPHTKIEFNQLMYWFFKRINRDLAAVKRLLPCPRNVLERGAYANLHSMRLDEILAAISQKLRSNS